MWVIKEWDGNDVRAEYSLPGDLSPDEVTAILQRMVCRSLTLEEILAASRRKGDPKRTSILDSVGKGHVIEFGHDPRYTAEKIDA
jgi:hypothetical protein